MARRYTIDLEQGWDAPLKLVQKRQMGLQYDVDHLGGDTLFIVTNKDDAINRRLMTASLSEPGMEHWKEAIPYNPQVKIDAAEMFKDFIAIEGREGGLTRLWLLNKKGETQIDPASFRRLDFPEDVGVCSGDAATLMQPSPPPVHMALSHQMWTPSTQPRLTPNDTATQLYEVSLSTNRVYDTSHVRLHYSSFKTPGTWCESRKPLAGTASPASVPVR